LEFIACDRIRRNLLAAGREVLFVAESHYAERLHSYGTVSDTRRRPVDGSRYLNYPESIFISKQRFRVKQIPDQDDIRSRIRDSEMPLYGDVQLSPDELEYLWHVAKRSNIKLNFRKSTIERLIALGLVTIDFDWPKLTRSGQKILDASARNLWEKAIESPASSKTK
jgi:hypothetical protein